MAIVVGSKVKVSCPAGSEAKYPSFYRAFHGLPARVVQVFHRNLLQINIAQEGQPPSFINVERQWLAAVKG